MTSRRPWLAALPTLVAALVLSGAPGLALAQEPPGMGRHSPPTTVDAAAPRLIHSTGRLTDGLGSPIVGVVTVTFAVYERQSGGPALWVEIQRLTTDTEGRYSALLGAVSPGGVPVDLFSSTAPRWLGVQAEQLPERPRVLLVSVPYAMKAADAETLGGRPASDYLLAAAAQPQAQATGSSDKSLKGQGTPGALPLFTALDTLGDSVLFQSSGNVGIGTLNPAARLDVSGDVRSTGRVTAATGRFSASTGTSETLRAEISATGGYAIIGLASPGPTQTGTGVFGWLLGQNGAAVVGEASATTGITVGVQGRAHSPSGVGGLFENSAGGDLVRAQTTSGNTRFRVDANGTVHAGAYRDLAGNPIPSGDITAVSGGTGLTGGGAGGDVSLSLDTAFTDARYAAMLHGHVVGDVVGAATLGANAFSGNQTVTGLVSVTGGVNSFVSTTSPGVLGQSSAANGLGVRGTATGTGQTRGVLGFSNSPSGAGVEGESVSLTGATVGVLGKVVSPDGVAVFGQSLQNSGTTAGLKGTVHSAAGFAGLFDNVAGGTILSGRRNGVERFRVDGDGNIYATGYRDLAGNPIPSGTGDITAVTGGSGLTGGGAAGDVSLSLDSAFTDARYARLSAANLFTGNQAVVGGVAVSGDVTAAHAAFSSVTSSTSVSGQSALFANSVLGGTVVRAETMASSGVAIRGVTTGTSGAAIVGEANATSGSPTAIVGNSTRGNGVQGESLGVSGNGVKGRALGIGGVGVFGLGETAVSTTGVLGISESTSGRGMDARANASSGLTYGVMATARSTSGTALLGTALAETGNTFGLRVLVTSPDGVAGQFESLGGGDLLVGRASDVDAFRVDASGAVYASSYRDLAGNPIPAGTGDITAVSSGTGLTGGGGDGDVSLALDTAYTDTRYAMAGHGHSVNQVAGAATLGANAFAGNQQVTGTLAVSGAVSAETASFTTTTGIRTLNVAHQGVNGVAIQASAGASSGSGIGIQGSTSSTNGTGVFGQAGALTGSGIGVRGVTFSGSGIGVSGQVATSANGGVAVYGNASPTSGTAIGVFGVSNSPGGIAGVFENGAGGRLIVGQAGGVHKFRVSSNGTVEAVEYRDMSGNLIGQQGPAGPAGPAGAQGPTGPQGAAGVSGYEVVSGSSAYASATSQSFPLSCPAGKVAVGGGGQVDYESGVGSGPLSAVITGSFPGEGSSWRVQASEVLDTDRSWRLNVWVICALTTQ